MAFTDIDKPSDYFNTKLYTGTGSSLANTGVGFQPDLTWIKGRSGATEHVLTDSVRGVTKELSSNDNGAEETVAQGLTAFGSDGFTVGTDGSYNTSSATYVSWNWKIESGIFDIQTWTGNGSNRTIAHNLGVAPEFYLVKEIVGSANDWTVYYGDPTDFLILNESNATSDSATRWNDTAPTASVFSLGTATGGNRNSSTYIGYFFASKQGVSKIGSYVGNGSTDGTFVYTGFKPAFFILKRTDSAAGWYMIDNKRGNNFNVIDKYLQPSTGSSEQTTTFADFVSNGVKLKTSADDLNVSGGNFIYMAFAESPFVTSTGIPTTAR